MICTAEIGFVENIWRKGWYFIIIMSSLLARSDFWKAPLNKDMIALGKQNSNPDYPNDKLS